MKQLIVKSNLLVEAKYKLTTNEQRIILFILSEKIRKNDIKFGVYKFYAEELKHCFGRGMESFERIVETIKKLRTRSIKIWDGNEEIDTDWVSYAAFNWDTKEITVEFPQSMEPYLLQLKSRFTSYRVENIIYLKSLYSIRIYELLKQYLQIKSRTFNINELKEILCIPHNGYSRYSHFRIKVLDVAHRQINENSDVSFKYEPIKKGKKVVEILFHNIETQPIKREQQIPGLEDKQFVDQELFDSLIKYGCSPSESEKYIKKYPVELIERNLKYSIAEDEKGKVDNKRGFIKSALDRDFAFEGGNSTSNKDIKATNKKKMEKVIQEWKAGNNSKEIENKIENYYKEVGHPIYKNWKSFV